MEGAKRKDSEEFYEDMLDSGKGKEVDPFGWECTGRMTVHEEEHTGMYMEQRQNRKRTWQEVGGKIMRKEEEQEKEQRKMPPKKILAAVGEMGGSGSSSSSHVSPVWQVNDLDLELPGELSMKHVDSEALLSLPSLAVFKQEAPSPTGASTISPGHNRQWPRRQDDRQITRMAVDSDQRVDVMCQQLTGHAGSIVSQHAGSPETMQCQPSMGTGTLIALNGYHSPPTSIENKGGGLLICSPASSLDGLLSTPPVAPCFEPNFRDDTRFQYVLAAATSIATKTNEETLTYLNQGQPYEIKLKKLGDLSNYKGKILKSVIKICFHERRLQYMEREQIAQWHQERPGERIVEVDIPLSYGVTRVVQPPSQHMLNAVEVFWDPTKDVGVYVKVNCISTEFTAKKHGGEKGVPFRIQVETYLNNDTETRVHAAACQIKVFKLKGADRKHKQDREKVLRRPRTDLDKYQPGCEATVLTTLSNDALLLPPSLVTTSSPSYSPELCMTPKAEGSPRSEGKPMMPEQARLSSPANQMNQLYCPDSSGGEVAKLSSPTCHSPGTILPDLPQSDIDADKNWGLSKDATAAETQAWLAVHRFAQHAATFSNYSGSDLLRLSRNDLIEICGLADGIRLFNVLHAKRIEPRLTVYVSAIGSGVYNVLYLNECRARELVYKLRTLLPQPQQRNEQQYETVLVSGPRGVRVQLTDDLVRHMPDGSTYRLERLDNEVMLLSATE